MTTNHCSLGVTGRQPLQNSCRKENTVAANKGGARNGIRGNSRKSLMVLTVEAEVENV